MTNQEKETIILFNEAEPTARIETFNGRIIREAEKASTRSEDVVCEERADSYGVYTMPKTYIKIRAPRPLSEAQLESSLKSAQKAREMRRKR